jgi:CRP/FNR family cyclic AMP-dependent transcriptional regulator
MRHMFGGGSAKLATDGAGAIFEEQKPFPAGLRDAFLERARLIRVPRDHIIIYEGSETSEVYLIRSGSVQISLYSLSGRKIILRDMGPDMIFGELAAIDRLPRSANVKALEDCVLAVMRGERFLEVLGSVPQTGLWMCHALAAHIRNLTARAFELATLPVVARIHGELLRRANEAGIEGDRAVVSVGRGQAEFASRIGIGSHREAISRELNALEDEGILRKSGSRVEILSVAKLQMLCDRFSS